MKYFIINLIMLALVNVGAVAGQSRRTPNYSDSDARSANIETQTEKLSSEKNAASDEDVIRIDSDLVIIPAQITDRKGRVITDLQQREVKIFENGIEQSVAFFSNEEQPFTVAVVLDMSYSSVFKLKEIQDAALSFVDQLRPDDRVMIISFDEKARVLCEPTSSRKILRLAVEAARIASGTSLYTALDLVLTQKLRSVEGRKAVVILSDGVDTTSEKVTAADLIRAVGAGDALIYPIQYDTYEDVQKNRKNNAETVFDENDRPIAVDPPQKKGERADDYKRADELFQELSTGSGGIVYQVKSSTNLNKAFANIAATLRKTYSLGYYPDNRRGGGKKNINVRVYRPNLVIHARSSYTGREK